MSPPHDPSPLHPVRAGDLFDGAYRVGRVLRHGERSPRKRGASGGAWLAFEGRELARDLPVIVHCLLPAEVGEEALVERFLRETRAASGIASVHVPHVLGRGSLENGAPYVAIERVEGETLETCMRGRAPLPVPLAVDVVLQVATALADAHARGLVHANLSPGQLVCAPGAGDRVHIEVHGLGLASVSPFEEGPRACAYVSPEQAEAPDRIDPQTDLWALGVIFYELLAGRVPFAGETSEEVMAAITARSIMLLRALRTDLPGPLEAVVLQCLETERADRYLTVGELATDLRAFAAPESQASIDRILGILDRAGLTLSTWPPPAPPIEDHGVAELARSLSRIPRPRSK